MTESNAAPSSPVSPALNASAADAPPLQSSLHAEVTEAHAREALIQDIQGAVAKGRLTKEQADAHFQRIGATQAEQQTPAVKPDGAADALPPGFEGGKPSDYSLVGLHGKRLAAVRK